MDVAEVAEVSGNTTRSPRKQEWKSRNWCFTEFSLKKPEHKDITYSIYQLEKCPDTGREHYQGYVEMSKTTGLAFMKKILETAHWEPRKGTQDQAIAYCSKVETRVDGPWEHGTRKQQGKRSDLISIQTAIHENVPLRTIANEHFGDYLRYHKGIERYIELQREHRNTPPRVTWIWGDAGSGKTRYIYDKHTSIYSKAHGKWWDGYEQQEVILLDEFDRFMPREAFLTLTDRYPLTVETKGGTTKINSPFIYITSNWDPNEYLIDDAMKRRITETRKM